MKSEYQRNSLIHKRTFAIITYVKSIDFHSQLVLSRIFWQNVSKILLSPIKIIPTFLFEYLKMLWYGFTKEIYRHAYFLGEAALDVLD